MLGYLCKQFGKFEIFKMAAVAILKFSNSEQNIKIPRIMIYTLISVVFGHQI